MLVTFNLTFVGKCTNVYLDQISSQKQIDYKQIDYLLIHFFFCSL